MECVIDRKTIKLLEYINKHRGIVEGKLFDKFGREKIGFRLACLAKNDYLFLISKEEMLWLNPSQMTYQQMIVYGKDKNTHNLNWYPTGKAIMLLENNRKEVWRQSVPVILSILSLGFSLANLIIQLFNTINVPTATEPIQVILTTLAPTTVPSVSPIPTLPPMFPFIP